MNSIYYFNITYRCNSNCLFCAADYELSDHPKKDLDIETFKSVLEQHAVGESDRVVINGGEPTVHKRFFEMLELVKARGAYIDLFTNGVRLGDEGFVRELLRYGPMLIRIPLFGADAAAHDGLTGVKGNFDRVLAGLGHILALRGRSAVQLELKLLLSRATASENPKIFDLLSHRFPKAFYFSLNPLLVSEQVKQRQDSIFQNYSSLVMESLDLIRTIRSKGWALSLDLIPLCLFPADFLRKEHMGVNRDLREVYADPDQSFEAASSYTSSKCSRCLVRKRCAGFPASYIEFAGDSEAVPIESLN